MTLSPLKVKDAFAHMFQASIFYYLHNFASQKIFFLQKCELLLSENIFCQKFSYIFVSTFSLNFPIFLTFKLFHNHNCRKFPTLCSFLHFAGLKTISEKFLIFVSKEMNTKWGERASLIRRSADATALAKMQFTSFSLSLESQQKL